MITYSLVSLLYRTILIIRDTVWTDPQAANITFEKEKRLEMIKTVWKKK